MNAPSDPLVARLDRLVDGQLDPAALRDLVARLDCEPDGWRRCALALLEAQAWREALAPSPAPEPIPIPRRAPIRRGASRPIARFGLVAAALLAAFLLGLSTGGAGREPSAMPRVADRPSPRPEARPVAARATGTETIGSILVASDGAGGVRVPVLSGPGLDERWLRDQPGALPEYVRAQMERRGYQVAQHRELLSVDLEDGSRLAVPVDQVEFQYVGSRPY